jgi:hypothetical protein
MGIAHIAHPKKNCPKSPQRGTLASLVGTQQEVQSSVSWSIAVNVAEVYSLIRKGAVRPQVQLHEIH